MQRYTKAPSVILALVLIGTIVSLPGLGQSDPNDLLPDEVSVPFTGISTVYSEDFAEGDGGFTTGGTAGTWEFGVPASPPEILEGQTPNVWGTNLDGDHASNDCGWIQSPAIDLAGYPAAGAEGTVLARLSMTHWIDARMFVSSVSGPGNAYSGGIVMVSGDGENWAPIEPAGGYDSTGVYSGQANCLGVDSDQGIYSVRTSEDTPADAWRNGEFDISAFLGGELHVRWFFGAGATSVTERGWYLDSLAVEVGAGLAAPTPDVPGPNDVVPDDVTVPFTPVSTLYSEDFAEGDGGYTAGGTSTWEFGGPTSPPEIREGQTPDVWGTRLDSDYQANECGYVQTPAIDLSGAPAGTAMLSFDHWLHAEMSSFSGTAWDGGVVMVSADGENFTIMDPVGGYNSEGVFSSLRNCLGVDSDQRVFSTTSSPAPAADAWETAQFDISEYIGGDVTVRWMFGSDGSVHNRGWYIDAVQIDLGVGAHIDLPDLPDPNEHVPDEVIVPFTGLATAYSEDFAEGDGGFTAGGTSTWEFGGPVSPPEIREGQTPDVWGTRLGSDYVGNECGYVQTPAIDLSGYPAGMAMLTFDHWIHGEMSTFSGNAWDGGVVMVSADGENFTIMDPVGGYNSEGVFTSLRNCFDVDSDQQVYSSPRTPGPEADAWETAQFDVSEFVGSELTVRWMFGSDSFGHARGWYIDNINVEFGVGATVDVPDVPVPDDPDDVPVPDPNEFFPEPDPATGWAIGGESPSWEYGEVTDSSSNVNIRGEVGYMTNLDGPTNIPECGYIQSPMMLGSDFALDPTLRFEHWYRIPGAFVDVAWGGGLVMVSTDLGASWEYLDLPEYDRPLDYSGGYPECFTGFGAPLDGNVFSGVHTELTNVTVDLSGYLGSPTIMVRFVYGAATFDYEGWFINSVELGGQQILE